MDHHDQQIVLLQTRNLKLYFGTYVGTKYAKIEKILISRAILLGFLLAVKMLRDLQRRARGLAQHVAVANARTAARARMHNWSIGCQGSSRTKGCMMAHSKTRPELGEQTEQNSTCGGEISMVQSIQLGFRVSRSLGSATSNEANKSAMLRAEWTTTARRAVLRFVQMKYRYFVPECCKQNAIFSGTSNQNRSYLDNISTNR